MDDDKKQSGNFFTDDNGLLPPMEELPPLAPPPKLPPLYPPASPRTNPPQRNSAQRNPVPPVNSPRVKEKFVVHIEEASDESPAEAPRYNGEVYFSHPPRKSAQPAQAKPDAKPLRTGQAARATQRAAAQRAKAKKRRLDFGASVSYLLVCIIIALIAGGISAFAISCINDVLAINRDKTIVRVDIPDNASTAEVIDLLHESDLIHRPAFCKVFYDLLYKLKNPIQTDDKTGESIPRKPLSYNSGVYYLDADMGLEGLLNEFRFIRSSPKTVSLVFPEGYSVYQIAKRLDDAGVCKAEHFYAALEKTDFAQEYSSLHDLKDSPERTQLLEGYLFPAKYQFFEEENANSVIRRFLAAYNERWTPEYQQKADKLKLSMDQIIILASVIQREADNEEQMGGISMVLHNRMKNTVDHPTLGCDSTGDYILKDMQGALGAENAQAYFEKYNTRGTAAFPPGPICDPGKAAIEAALNPDESMKKYFFFRHDKNGKIYWATTAGEHYRNGETVNAVNTNS